MRPVNYIKPYDVPFHLRAGYEEEILDIIDAGIIAWNTKAFLVAKSDGTNCRVVGDWRGVNSILKKYCSGTLKAVTNCSGIYQLMQRGS